METVNINDTLTSGARSDAGKGFMDHKELIDKADEDKKVFQQRVLDEKFANREEFYKKYGITQNTINTTWIKHKLFNHSPEVKQLIIDILREFPDGGFDSRFTDKDGNMILIEYWPQKQRIKALFLGDEVSNKDIKEYGEDYVNFNNPLEV